MKHIVNQKFHTAPVYIDLIGVGGTGSLVLAGLTRLHMSMISLDHPGGLVVRVWDPDIVSRANIGRQLFVEEEVGLNKAVALVTRCNLHHKLNWFAEPRHFQNSYFAPNHSCHIIISCVDSRNSRAAIHQETRNKNFQYLIDSGNGNDHGQVFIGNNQNPELPHPWKVLPNLIDTKIKENRRASCSLAEALQHQELFINQWMATAVLQLLWQLFRHGGLDIRGYYINLESGRMIPVPIEESTKHQNSKKRKEDG